jgi:hypothetical protein
MPTTPLYQRRFSFTDWEANHAAKPAPGTALDAELDAIQAALTDLQQRLARIQNDSGTLANDSVGPDQLDLGLADQIGSLDARLSALEAKP